MCVLHFSLETKGSGGNRPLRTLTLTDDSMKMPGDSDSNFMSSVVNFRVIKGATAWAISIVGVLASAMALINAILFLTTVGLDAFLMKFVEFYRSSLEPLYQLVELLPISIPRICADLLVVYAVGVAISWRLFSGIKHVENVNNFAQELHCSPLGIAIPYNLYWFIYLFHLRKHIGIRQRYGIPEGELKALDASTLALLGQTLVSVALVPLGVLLFFIYNEFRVTS